MFRISIRFYSTALFIIIFSNLATAEVPQPYEVGTWGNFCTAAISHTFDDGTGNQFSIAVPLFDEKGFHMTFATVTSGNMFPGWKNLQGAYAKGHEIASHSVTHPNNVNDDEMKRSQAAIKSNVSGEMCVSMIYPYCNVPNESDVKKYYIAGRVCGGGPEGTVPGNIIRTASLIVGQGGAQTDLDGYANSALSKKGWAVFLHHGVDGDHSFASTSSGSLKNHLKFLDDNRDKYWVETFGNVARYIKEREADINLVETVESNSITVKITDNLPDSIFNYPLSIRRPLPDNWDEAKVTVTQNNDSTGFEIVTVNSKKYIMFQAVPDGGDVVLSSGTTGARHGFLDNRKFNDKTIQILRNRMVINTSDFSVNKIAVQLFNLKGETLASFSMNRDCGISDVDLSDEMIRSVFLVKATDGISTHTQKFMPQL